MFNNLKKKICKKILNNKSNQINTKHNINGRINACTICAAWPLLRFNVMLFRKMYDDFSGSTHIKFCLIYEIEFINRQLESKVIEFHKTEK